jgi:phage-related protein
MNEKPIRWIGSAKADLLSLPPLVRRRAGFGLWVIQQGAQPSDFKPMPIVGQGVEELRIQIDGAYRVFYVTSRLN